MTENKRESEVLIDLVDYLSSRLGTALVESAVAHGELTITVVAHEMRSVLKLLRDDARCQFEVLVDLCGVDWPARENRFEVVYHLLSPRLNQRLRVKTIANETEPVPSVIEIYPVADWFEREAYDMYGILFSDHPDLRRLLTD